MHVNMLDIRTPQENGNQNNNEIPPPFSKLAITKKNTLTNAIEAMKKKRKYLSTVGGNANKHLYRGKSMEAI